MSQSVDLKSNDESASIGDDTQFRNNFQSWNVKGQGGKQAAPAVTGSGSSHDVQSLEDGS